MQNRTGILDFIIFLLPRRKGAKILPFEGEITVSTHHHQPDHFPKLGKVIVYLLSKPEHYLYESESKNCKSKRATGAYQNPYDLEFGFTGLTYIRFVYPAGPAGPLAESHLPDCLFDHLYFCLLLAL